MTKEEAEYFTKHPGTRPPAELLACLPHIPEGHVLVGAQLNLGSPECGADASAHQNQIGTAPPPPELIERCRADAEGAPSCGIVLAMADGSLKPGRYSDEDLAAAVAAAGYKWEPEQ